MLPIWLLAAMMIVMYYWRFWEPCANAMLVVLLPKLWFWIENHDWHKCSWVSSWGSLLLGPKKLQNQQFLYNRLNKEKTPGRCCQSGYLLLGWLWCTIIGGLGTLCKCYVGSPVAKALVRDWKSWLAQLLLDVFLGLTLTGPKKASESTILYNRLNKEKNSWSKLQIWLLAAMMSMMYYWRFCEPCANAMLVVALVSQRFRERARALAETLWDQGDY